MTKLRFSAIALFLLTGVAAPAVAEYEEGLEAFRRGRYETALRELLPAAERYHEHSQLLLGQMYEDGLGVDRDFARAAHWYLRAAKMESRVAQYKLGTLYRRGEGVPRDDAKAAKWFLSAARLEHLGAMHETGVAMLEGRGTSRNEKQAAKWLRKAAEKGWSESQFRLAQLLAEGRGVRQDPRAAVEWAQKVAFRPHPEASLLLAGFYIEGQGIDQDLINARRLLGIAAAHRVPGAESRLESVEEALSAHGPVNLRKLGDEAHAKGQCVTAAYEWHRQAHRGDSAAQLQLARAYRSGRGVVRDPKRAFRWAQLALGNGQKRAEAMVDELAARLGESGVAEVEQTGLDLHRSDWNPRCANASDLHSSDVGVGRPLLLPGHARPKYPLPKNSPQIAANVLLEAIVDREGEIRCLRVLHCDTIQGEFIEAAMETVTGWRYAPATKGGEPVEVVHRIRIEFEP